MMHMRPTINSQVVLLRKMAILLPLFRQNRVEKLLLRMTSLNSKPQNLQAQSIASHVASMYSVPPPFPYSYMNQFMNQTNNFCRNFNSDNALQSHTKAKHSAGKWDTKIIFRKVVGLLGWTIGSDEPTRGVTSFVEVVGLLGCHYECWVNSLQFPSLQLRYFVCVV